jgi:hypothetical protein
VSEAPEPLSNVAPDDTGNDNPQRANTLPAKSPTLTPQPNGRGALLVGGNWGNRGGGRRPDWLKQRMTAALRAGKAAEVVRDIISGDIYEQIGVDRDGRPIYGTTRNADRLRAVDLAAELAGLKPKPDMQVAVAIEFRLSRE